MPLLQSDTLLRCPVPLAWKRSLHRLENSLLQIHDSVIRIFEQVCKCLDAIRTSGNFYPARELEFVEKAIRCRLSGLLVLHRIWKLFQSSHVADQILLVACYLGILLCTLMGHCKNVIICQACLALDGVANNILSRRCLSLWTRPISLRIPFLRLNLLTVDSNYSGLGPYEVFALVSKVEPRRSCSCLAGLALIHSTVIPLRTARL